MRLGKALIGGVIGGAISIAVIAAYAYYQNVVPPDWFALIAGVVTGLGVRLLGKSDKPGPSYACGAIAAFLTLAAFYGGNAVSKDLMEARVDQNQIRLNAKDLPDSMVNPPPVVGSAEDEVIVADEEADEETDPSSDAEDETGEPADPSNAAEDEADVSESEEMEETEVDTEVPSDVRVSTAADRAEIVRDTPPRIPDPDFSVWSYAFIVVGALIAYELGRNCGCSKPVA